MEQQQKTLNKLNIKLEKMKADTPVAQPVQKKI
jgi:hypothetical protein